MTNENLLSNSTDHIGVESKSAAELETQQDLQKPTLPRNNRLYGTQQYWEERFEQEDEYDWLMTYNDVRDIMHRFIEASDHILIIGCGNSSFSADLYDAGFKNITNTDYSVNVILRMQKKHENARPIMKWMVMDMTDMSAFDEGSFDVVIDKAAMDALVTMEDDVWNPNQAVVDACHRTCLNVSRILKIDGYFLQFSFAQPHFRGKYLLGLHGSNHGHVCAGYGWDLSVEKIDGRDGCFQNYLYTMKKLT